MDNIHVSDYIHYLEVDEGMYIGWNRFFPSIFILNDFALELLERIKVGESVEADEETAVFLDQLKKYKFVYEGEADPSREDFLRMVRQTLEEQDRRARDFYRLGEDYGGLKIVNDVCNLGCSYCVNEDSASGCTGVKVKMSTADKLHIVNQCVDQYFDRKVKRGVRTATVSFNGGEILVDWGLVRPVLERMLQKYPDMEIQFNINTNLTLLTEEIADFFKQHHFRVSISIDGYEEAHNRTRKYHNGKSTFEDIIGKVRLFRKINDVTSLTGFQGTIEFLDDFRPEEVYKMGKYGFSRARLAPNLLGSTEEDGRKKARLMGTFLQLNEGKPFRVTELIFTRSKNKINSQTYEFALNCAGLSVFPQLNFEINLTTLAVSQLCSFIRRATLPFEGLQYDIYNPKLWEWSYGFICERMDVVLTECLGCELVGICSGGCILSGLDGENRLNKGACAYQQEMWAIYVRKAYDDRGKTGA